VWFTCHRQILIVLKLGMQPGCGYILSFLSLSVAQPGLALVKGMYLSSPGLNASCWSLPLFPVWCLGPPAQSTCRLRLLGSYFTGLCSLLLLFLYYIYTLLAIVNWALEHSVCRLIFIDTVSSRVTQAGNKWGVAVIEVNIHRITTEKQKMAFVEIRSYLCATQPL